MDYDKLERLLLEFPIEHKSCHPLLLGSNIRKLLQNKYKEHYQSMEKTKWNFASRLSFFKKEFWFCKRDRESVEKMLIGIFAPAGVTSLPDSIFDLSRLNIPSKEYNFGTIGYSPEDPIAKPYYYNKFVYPYLDYVTAQFREFDGVPLSFMRQYLLLVQSAPMREYYSEKGRMNFFSKFEHAAYYWWIHRLIFCDDLNLEESKSYLQRLTKPKEFEDTPYDGDWLKIHFKQKPEKSEEYKQHLKQLYSQYDTPKPGLVS